MNLIDFTDEQRQAILDLAMLAIYADGHLAAAEDERVKQLLTAMGYNTPYDQAKHYDASVSRVSRHAGTGHQVRIHARSLAQPFTDPSQQKLVYNILHDLVASDSRVSPAESAFLATVREALTPGAAPASG